MVKANKTVWLINHAAMPPQYEVRIQTLKRAEYLRKQGYKVYVIGGSFLHNTNINLINNKVPFKQAEYEGGHQFIHIRTRSYASNGVSRMINLLEFFLRLWWHARKFERPDYVSHIAAVPFGNITYYVAKKVKAKFIVDVVDLWPESFVAYGLVSKKNILLKLSYLAEYWLYKKADLLIFSMEGGKDYVKEKGWSIEQGGKVDLSKIHYINNGVDLKDFEYNKEHFKIEDADLENDQLFRVVYVGSIRLANNLQQLIDAANLLKEHKNILFLVYGDGEDRNSLEELCKTKELTNVKFKQKWVELKYIPYILSKSSLNVLNYKNSDILRFGGSQSKSFQYMASGKPICANVQMNYCPIKKFKLGIAQNFESSSAYAEAILSIYNLNKEEYDLLCQNAAEAAKHYDYQMLTNKFIAALQTI